MTILETSFFSRDTAVVAQQLLGKQLVHQINGTLLSGIIVETEAYAHANDPASHAYRRKTTRNYAMFGDVGHSYVYFIYGNCYCFNVVAYDETSPAGAVLIRALQPLRGIEWMQSKRSKEKIRDLTTGPGKLTQALGITKEHNGQKLHEDTGLYLLEEQAIESFDIVAAPRVGIREGLDKLWRFSIKNHPFVSR